MWVGHSCLLFRRSGTLPDTARQGASPTRENVGSFTQEGKLEFKNMDLGNLQIYSIVENSFKIDGGAMFGVVPKILWQKYVPADKDNFITLDINLLLVRSQDKNILIDTGTGDTLTKKQKEMFGVEKPSNLDRGLKNLGLSPEDIDIIVLSHLHADHSGGVVKLDKDGNKIPHFPDARHYVQKQEWEDANNPDERTSATYLVETLMLLKQNNLLQLVDGEKEIVTGVMVSNSHGHTSGHQIVWINGGREKVIYAADIIPTTAHLRAAYVASVDLYPKETMQIKKEIIRKCLEQNWMLALDHDVNTKLCRLKQEDGRIVFEKVEFK